jgi:hypothetical protein
VPSTLATATSYSVVLEPPTLNTTLLPFSLGPKNGLAVGLGPEKLIVI